MSAVTHNCASCGNDLPVGARFCASCGARAAPIGRRVTWSTSERRYFGVIPGRTIVSAAHTRIGRWLTVARSRSSLALAIVSARLQAGIARYRLRRDLGRLARKRPQLLQTLGDAEYRGDRKLAASIRGQIGELDQRMGSLTEEIEGVNRWAEDEIARARIEGASTNVVEPSPDDPRPPIVPEPEPVPSDPPGPVIVPEPEPVPHDPPGPVIVPEPQQPTE